MSTKEERVAEIVAAHAGREGPLLPILHDVQHAFGCVDAESEALIAKALNLSRADVHGVVSLTRSPAAFSAAGINASTPRALQASARQICTSGRGSARSWKSW